MKAVFSFLFLLGSLTIVQSQTKIEVDDYHSIDAFGAVDIELIQSDKSYIIIDYNRVDKEDMVADVSNGTLRLKIKNKHYMDEWSSNKYKKTDYVRVKAYYTSLREIEGNAGVIIKSKQPIVSKKISIDCSMGAQVDLIIVADYTKLRSSMGGELTLNGKTDFLDIRSSMGSDIQAENFKANVVDISASMGSVIRVHAEKELEASTSLGAQVFYSGDPNKRHASSNLGGEVKHRN